MNRCLMVLLVLGMLTIGTPTFAESSSDTSDTIEWFGKSEAQSPPVQVKRGTSYWWWPTSAKSNVDDSEQWGNRGTIFGKMAPPLPPPPIPEQPPVVEEPVVEAIDPFAEEPVVEEEEIQIAMIPEPEPEPIVEEEELPVEPVQVAEVVEEVIPEEVIPEPTRSIPVFNNLMFDFDKSVLTSDGHTLLEQVIANLNEYVNDTLSIEGHTDNINRSGNEEYNVLLGQRRADAVLKALLEGGIDASRIVAVSRGDTEPAVGNDSETNRALNRRVLFKYSIGD